MLSLTTNFLTAFSQVMCHNFELGGVLFPMSVMSVLISTQNILCLNYCRIHVTGVIVIVSPLCTDPIQSNEYQLKQHITYVLNYDCTKKRLQTTVGSRVMRASIALYAEVYALCVTN